MRIEENKPRGKELDYVASVNRAIDHVLKHLAQPLKLEIVARVAGFSPFHFHRVFHALVGETLADFVKRLRLERALAHLSITPRLTLTEIALNCGFASSSDFSRSFKQRYGMPPSVFDIDSFRTDRRDEWQSAMAEQEVGPRLDCLPVGENPDGFEVQLKRIPNRHVAYMRVLDPFRKGVVPEAVERMVRWAEERDLADGQWLGYMWDDPEIVAHEDCRYDVGLEVPTRISEGEIGCLDFPAMQVAELELHGGVDLEMRALDWLFKTWLPTSGFKPTDDPSFEVWIGRPFANGYEHFELLVQLPVASG